MDISYKFANFPAAMGFMMQVAILAENRIITLNGQMSITGWISADHP